MNFNKILNELCWRLDTGIPDLTNPVHQEKLKDVLLMHGHSDLVIAEVIANLNEADKVDPDTMVKYKDDNGESKEMVYSSATRQEAGTPAKVAADKLQPEDEESESGEDEPTNDDNATEDDESEDAETSEETPEELAAKSLHMFQNPEAGSDAAEASEDSSSGPSSIDRTEFKNKEKKHKDNPKGPSRLEILDSLNIGDWSILTEYQRGLEISRELGIAGMGGAVASEGESKYCNCVNSDITKFNLENQKSIKLKIEEIANRSKTKQDGRTAKALGLAIDSPEFNTYLAQREVWVISKREAAKSNPDSVFHKKAKEGFNSKDDAYDEWMVTSYDGAMSTKQSIAESSIDTSKQFTMVQSTEELDQAVEAHLEDNVTNAKSPEDRVYAENQLKYFSKFKSYHDTYVIGQDKEGRTTYMGVSNKKDDQIRDPQNNSSPKKRFEELKARYGIDVAEAVMKSLHENTKRVSEVKETTVDSANGVQITDDFVAVCESDKMKPYIKSLRNTKSFRNIIKKKGLDIDTMDTKAILEEMNAQSKAIIGSGKKPSYSTYAKIAIKVGELAVDSKFKRDNPSLNFEDYSVKAAAEIKQKEKDVVKKAHSTTVKSLIEADMPDGYSKENPEADNGPHVEGYITGVLDACHIDTYIDMDSDDAMLLQMGINGVKPSMIRECVGEQSGFTGDSSTPEGKSDLKNHLRKRCRVKPGGNSITINDASGKDIELFDDFWRTAGASQKVATGFGKGMRDCLQEKAARK
jgi:ASC-1-like (ASCH) protein